VILKAQFCISLQINESRMLY